MDSELRAPQRCRSANAASYQAYPKPTAGDGKGLSPRQKRKPKADAQKGLTRNNSSYSASPTSHLFRTASPYRRALRKSIKEAQASERAYSLDTRYLSSLSALSLPTRRLSSTGSDRQIEASDTESNYSIATKDVEANNAEDDAKVGGKSNYFFEDNDQAGESSSSGLSASNAPTIAHGRNISSTSSVEWKTWLSANVSKLETPSTTVSGDSRGELYHSLVQSFGHVREDAEIESPSELPMPEMLKALEQERGTPARQRRRIPHAPSPSSATRPMDSGHELSLKDDENSPPFAGRRDSKGVGAPPLIPLQSELRNASLMVGAQSGEGERRDDLMPRMRLVNTKIQNCPARDEEASRRRGRACAGVEAASPTASSPGLTAAVEKQFGKVCTGSPRGRDWKLEEGDTTPRRNIDGKSNGTESAGFGWDFQVMGSKRIVELFLSSRRRRIKSSATATDREDGSLMSA